MINKKDFAIILYYKRTPGVLFYLKFISHPPHYGITLAMKP